MGAKVKDFKVGDHVGVGCIVDSCATCENCKAGNEEYCCKGFTQTYNSETKYGRIKTELGYTLGGYSSKISVNQNYILRIPKGYPMDKAGPVFCSGITMFSPLQYWGAEKGGKKVGIIGVGGLGQMGIRIAAAMGNEVTAISRSASKKEVAESIGATNYVVSTDPESMKKAAKSLDLILNTVSAKHQAGHYMSLLNYDGTLVQLGLVTEPHMVRAFF